MPQDSLSWPSIPYDGLLAYRRQCPLSLGVSILGDSRDAGFGDSRFSLVGWTPMRLGSTALRSSAGGSITPGC
jgi:hypothetical protein